MKGNGNFVMGEQNIVIGEGNEVSDYLTEDIEEVMKNKFNPDSIRRTI